MDPATLYGRDRCVALGQLASPAVAADLLAAARDVPSRRVKSGAGPITWEEQLFEPGHAVHEWFRRPELERLVLDLARCTQIERVTCWSSRYVLGEYINPHRDRLGSLHVVVCLRAPHSPHSGGTLVVGSRELVLRVGDAVAFEASTLEHFTTPLVATSDDPWPMRIVVVGRYFLAGRISPEPAGA